MDRAGPYFCLLCYLPYRSPGIFLQNLYYFCVLVVYFHEAVKAFRLVCELASVECESLLSLAYLTSKLAFNSLARLTNLAHQLSRKHLQECAKGGSSES